MRWRITVFGTLGALATIVGAVFVLVPELVLGIRPVETLVSSLANTSPKAVMTAAAAVVGLYALVAARSTSDLADAGGVSEAERRFDAARTDPPEAVTADRRVTTGAGIDADVQLAVASGGRPLRALRDLLGTLAIEAYAEAWGTTQSEARRAVETGAWTDSRVAAAFLAGEEGPTATILSRVRLWLAPERERRRRIDTTLDEIERLRREQ